MLEDGPSWLGIAVPLLQGVDHIHANSEDMLSAKKGRT